MAEQHGMETGADRELAAIKEGLWLVGQYKGGEPPNCLWEFQGVFSTKDLAVAACRDGNYWICRVKLDESLPHETMVMTDEELGVEWPRS